MLKKVSLVAFLLVVVTAVGIAQDSAYYHNEYQLNYYSNRNNAAGADAVVRIINPGTQGTPIQPVAEGTICADIYVFDSTQEMLECCHCRVTANGILQLSILKDLTQDPLTGFPAPDSGVIKVVADDRANCNELAPKPISQLLAWASHVQQPVTGTFVTTEDHFQFAPLTYTGNSQTGELDFLGQTCSFVQYLGSGKGVCKCGSAS
jgi:hypothetical protein